MTVGVWGEIARIRTPLYPQPSRSALVSDVNWRDLFFKLFWTAVVAVLGVATVAVADLPYAWAPVVAVVANAVLAFARQKTGATPPTA